MTERHPLSDALDDAENSPQAQAYEVPVELIRSRARRRRRARTGGAAGALALVVAGAALVVPNLPSPTPAPATDDRPAPGLCGLTYDELAADDGGPDPWPVGGDVPAGLEIDENSVRQGAKNTWSVSTTFGATSAVKIDDDGEPSAGESPAPVVSGTPTGARYGTTLTLLRDGVVVAAQTGNLATPYTDKDPHPSAVYETAPFPQDDRVVSTVAPCTPEPLTAGTYDLVATQTMFWSYPEGGGGYISRTTSEPVPVEVDGPAPLDPSPAPTLPGVCGVSTEGLAAGDGIEPRAGEDDVNVDWWHTDVQVPRVEPPESGQATWHVPVTTAVDAPTVDFLWLPTGLSLGATVVLVRDGAVVAVLDNDDHAMSLEEAARTQIEGVSRELPLVQDLRASFISCATGEQAVLDPGQYDLLATTTVAWRVIDPAKNDQTTYTAVARTTSTPIAVTVPVRTPVVEQTPSSTARPSVACGETINPLGWRSRSTWLGKIQLSIADEAAADPHARLGNERKEPVTISRTQVLATRGGVVIGYIVSDLWDVSVEAGSVYFSPPISSLGEMTWCPGVTPPEDYGTSLAVDVVDESGTTSYLAAALPREPAVPAAGVQCGDELAPRDYPARAARTTDVRLTTRHDGDGWKTLVATNTGALPVSIAVQGHAGLLLEQDGRLVGSSLLTLDARPPEVLAPGASIDVVTISPGQFGSCGDRHVEIAAGPARAWALVWTDLGELVSGPYAIEMPSGDS